MSCVARLRPRRRVVLGVLLGTPILWAVVLAVVPTDCARRKVAERLSRATGRTVTIGKIRLGPLGGVSLSDLRIGAPGAGDDPWLMVDQASLDVGLFRMLFGQIDPTSVVVEGLTLRVHRRPDGSLELADLLRPEAPAASGRGGGDDAREPTGLEVRLRNARVVLVDDPNRTRLELIGVEGRGTCKDGVCNVYDLRGVLNGGSFRLAAQLDRAGPKPTFEGHVTLRDVALGDGMGALRYLVPALSGTSKDLEGTLALDLYLRGRCESREALGRTVVGHGTVALDPVKLDGSRLVDAIAKVNGLAARDRVGSVRADLKVQNRKVLSDNLTLALGRVPVVFAGWTDFDGRVDYRLRADGLSEKLSGQARELLSELRIDLDRVTDVRVQGTIDDLAVNAGGVPLDGPENGRPADDLREIGRRVRDQFRR